MPGLAAKWSSGRAMPVVARRSFREQWKDRSS
jgi:hypothetical protein